ncbi:hypothetical protein ROHU_004832 [Labeo rohita]|uniref:Fucolectin tachylectin-4 pentraxin-1 domain-containing protein n=1 Tax=Labeo rohita TaxID=84645 RepID=A0A498NGZ3_LABRO|nr:hypothetical protein ROHU_004832 [Labeo rohita]
MLKVYRVNRVTITNRPTNGFRINGAVIRIGNFLDIYSNTVCATISTLADGATDTFSCGGMKGRYMIVHIPGDQKILSLSEVGVYGYLAGNVAVDGAATQSSTFMSWFAEKAIDSNRGLQQYPLCSSTLNESNPWWRLDLRDVYKISKVVVTNRNDCCAEQINGAEIHIGNSLENNGSDNPICAVIPVIPAGESYNYSCGGMEGRYVNLIIPGDIKILTLCEVEVYGQGVTLPHILSTKHPACSGCLVVFFPALVAFSSALVVFGSNCSIPVLFSSILFVFSSSVVVFSAIPGVFCSACLTLVLISFACSFLVDHA